ncbi:proteasome subunit alpha [Antribacter sp. KLBMP9083]|uniref:Proteasome subunit alpha n=1 Tax=Antribacter soli TaxID=2910976 RepID=A0AA41U773_9MICO|nr:proteasome subunit alpha [Antribacter soli]MCF4121246.1 proteasome subunit alpha [Antribacter soli]
MTMPFYVSPEQLMKDRADFARKGIARGRSVVVLAYDGGIAFATANPSRALHKISEIYDRIAFAAVGKYNEFENLRVAGVRYADLRGYSYDRSDVTARGLANAYAQTLGTVFITESKPLEVELVVAEVGASSAQDQIYRLTYDGTVADEHGYVVMGGKAETLGRHVEEAWRPGMALGEVLRLAVGVLGSGEGSPAGGAGGAGGAGTGSAGTAGAGSGAGSGAAAKALVTGGGLDVAQLEVAVLERARPRRAFRRLTGQVLADLLAEDGADDAPDADGPSSTAPGSTTPDAPPVGGTPGVKQAPAAPEAGDKGDSEGDKPGSGDEKESGTD